MRSDRHTETCFGNRRDCKGNIDHLPQQYLTQYTFLLQLTFRMTTPPPTIKERGGEEEREKRGGEEKGGGEGVTELIVIPPSTL